MGQRSLMRPAQRVEGAKPNRAQSSAKHGLTWVLSPVGMVGARDTRPGWAQLAGLRASVTCGNADDGPCRTSAWLLDTVKAQTHASDEVERTL